jgi:hypothetical protein
MMYGQPDWFVGSVAVLLGLLLLTAAWRNVTWLYALRSSRWLEARLTRAGTRWLHASLAVALIVLGWAITQGFRWQLLG